MKPRLEFIFSYDMTKDEEIAWLRSQRDWEHVVLQYMDECDYSDDYFSFLTTHAGWCPDCEKVENTGIPLTDGGTLENPNADGEYECGWCAEQAFEQWKKEQGDERLAERILQHPKHYTGDADLIMEWLHYEDTMEKLASDEE